MNREDIDKLLTGEKSEVLEAHSEIVSIQRDKSNLIRFGQDWLDESLVGGINNKMIFLGSRPGGGKTYHCSSTINNLLNKDINPFPVKILRLNLEMQTSALLLREVSKVLGRRPSDILKEPYSEEERPKVKAIVDSFMDERITNVSVALRGEDFRYMVQRFISEVDEQDRVFNEQELEKLSEEEIEKYKPRKTKKVCLIDHIHVYMSKEIIDTILAIQNDLKLLDRNLSFINYFQLNRDTENMWRDSKEKKVNPRNMLPNSTSIFLTDGLQQFADLVVGMVIPQVYDLDEFAAVHKERNKHLKEHFVEDNPDNNFVRLKGRNRIYYTLIKIRMLDSFDDPRLFCEVLDPTYEKAANKIYEENKKSSVSITTPVFTATLPPKFPTENETTTASIKPLGFERLHEAFEPPVVSDKLKEPF